MHILRRRITGAVAVLAAGALCGILAACLLEWTVALKSTEVMLDNQAWRLVAEGDALLTEGRTVLAAMNASPYKFCSEPELAYFRKLVFHAGYIHDAGRMVNGRVACSATLGRENLPQTQFESRISLADGARIFSSPSPYTTPNEDIAGESLGGSYVVLDYHVLKRLDSITPNRAMALQDVISGRPVSPVRQLPVHDGVVTDRNWQGRAGNYTLVTRCSTVHPACETTFANLVPVLERREDRFLLYGALGGITGALFGLACWLLYRRNRSGAQQLRRAVRKGRISIVYQPIVNLATRRIVGAEALARWRDEEGFAVGPDIFVKIAEQRGFVGEITKLVARKVLRDFASTLRSRDDFRLSINIAAADLSDARFLPTMEDLLARAGVGANRLALEITEGSTAHHDLAIATIGLLRGKGFEVHIDDFGTGYSSLSYLHALAVDAIKIDRSFTQAIGTESVTVSILPQILAMAETLKLQVIVEGIESDLQVQYFSAIQQPLLAQGWHFGRPVTAEAFHALLTAEDRKSGEIVSEISALGDADLEAAKNAAALQEDGVEAPVRR
jgi:sensor c-di-GMP phosphodiesterase-like protein